MNYRITSEAIRDLDAIWQYTFENWGSTQADRYLDGLALRFAWLTGNQGLWRPRPELGLDLFSYPHESHMVMFRLHESTLTILRVLHHRMDPGL